MTNSQHLHLFGRLWSSRTAGSGVVWLMQFLERIRRLKIYQEIPWRKSPEWDTMSLPCQAKNCGNSHGWKRWQLAVWLISSRSWTRMTSSRKNDQKRWWWNHRGSEALLGFSCATAPVLLANFVANFMELGSSWGDVQVTSQGFKV